MTLHIHNGSVLFGISVPLADFPTLLEMHLDEFPDTPDIELQGEQLRLRNFLEPEVESFVIAVCKWGGYEGIRGRVFARNPTPELRSALSDAAHHLFQHNPDCRGALNRLNRLDSLGSPSFASKHLRFIRPELCPVFDSILRDALPYSYDATGYGHFASDCAALASKLQDAHIHNPRNRPDGRWFAADVEAALYVYVKNSLIGPPE
jgi:hypothetical protein